MGKRHFLALAGFAALLATVLSACKGGILDRAEPVTNTYEFSEKITGIDIDTTSFDVRVRSSEDGVCRVVCREADTMLHDVSVKDGVLTIKKQKNSGIGKVAVNIPLDIEVSLPIVEKADITIKTSSGDQHLAKAMQFANAYLTASSGTIVCEANVTGTISTHTSSGEQYISSAVAAYVDAEASSGDIRAEALPYGDYYSFRTSSGEVILSEVAASKTLEIETTSGEVKLTDCDSAYIHIKTTSGNVKGSLHSGKRFTVKTSSGDVKVPEDALTGGTCEIRTSSGDVRINIYDGTSNY